MWKEALNVKVVDVDELIEHRRPADSAFEQRRGCHDASYQMRGFSGIVLVESRRTFPVKDSAGAEMTSPGKVGSRVRSYCKRRQSPKTNAK